MEREERHTQERSEKAETMSAIKSCKRIARKDKVSFYDCCKQVMEDGAKRYQGMLIDSFSASAYTQVIDQLSEKNSTNLAIIAAKNPARAMDIVWQLIK